MKRYFLILSVLFFSYSANAQLLHKPSDLYFKMMQGMANVRTARYVLNLEERVFDKKVECSYIVKLQAKPQKIYTYVLQPTPGAEALYVEGTNSNKILVNPNSFPYINLSLPVNSMLLRKSHQYTMLKLGFSYLHNMLGKYLVKDSLDFMQSLSVKEDIIVDNRSYHVLEINNKRFGYVNYTVQKGENVCSIADKMLLNDHMILEVNRDISDYDDVKPGQVIKVPNSFAKRIVFYIDKATHLPFIQTIYDDKGFYTKITFSSFLLNPVIYDEEFTRSYPKYKF